jgi:hypothetical protein
MNVIYKVYTIFMITVNVKQHVIKFYSLSAICEWLSTECGSLDVTQPYRPSRPATWISFLYLSENEGNQ